MNFGNIGNYRIPLILTILVFIIITVIMFVVPVWYKSSTTLLIAKQDGSSLGGLLGAAKDFLPIKAGKAKDEERFLTILASERFQWELIEEFDLTTVYDIKEYKRTNTLKEFKSNFYFDIQEDNSLLIEYWDIDSIRSRDVLIYAINTLNKINSELIVEEASNNLIYINERYNNLLSELKTVEDSMLIFQSKYGIIDLESQAKLFTEVFTELETRKMAIEMQKLVTSSIVNSVDNSQFTVLEKQITLLEDKIGELIKGKYLEGQIKTDISMYPEVSLKYLRKYREMEIKNRVLVYIIPLIEQAKLEVLKKVPSVLVLDKPQVPEKKDKPKRLLFIFGFTLSTFFISITITLYGLNEKLLKNRLI